MRKPSFFIVGVSKAGTEWLKLCLKKHPEIFIPDGPNPNYFSHKFSRGEEWYMSLFEQAKNEKELGEKSTSYIIYPQSAKRIYNYNPNAKIIFVLRDPVERAFSHYKMKLRRGDVGENVDSVLSKKSPLVQEGLYTKHTSRYLDYFDDSKVHILLFDDLEDNPIQFIMKIYSILGVNSDFIPKMAHQRYHVTKSRPRFQRLYNTLVAVIRKLRRQSYWANRGIEFLRKKGYVNMFHRLNRGKPFPELSDKKREELGEFYREDINKLERMIDRDLSHWCSV
jgi:hypothetical protein